VGDLIEPSEEEWACLPSLVDRKGSPFCIAKKGKRANVALPCMYRISFAGL